MRAIHILKLFLQEEKTDVNFLISAVFVACVQCDLVNERNSLFSHCCGPCQKADKIQVLCYQT